MQLYLSAPHSNWMQDAMKQEGEQDVNLYLAGNHSRPYVWEKNHNMNVYLAGAATGNNNYLYRNGKAAQVLDYSSRLYVLESFFYIQDWMLPYIKERR